MSLPMAPSGINEPDSSPTESPAAVVTPAPSAMTGAVPADQPQLSFKALLREIVETIILTVIIYAAVNFATGRFKVEGSSMEPSIYPNEYVLVDKLSYRLGQPQRGDVVVFNYPRATEKDFIKRVVGLPGETVSIANGVVSVNGRALTEPYIAAPPVSGGEWTLSPDQYFVMGDNRNNSSDSRSWGALDRKYLIGKAVVTYWPPELWGLIPHFIYAETP